MRRSIGEISRFDSMGELFCGLFFDYWYAQTGQTGLVYWDDSRVDRDRCLRVREERGAVAGDVGGCW